MGEFDILAELRIIRLPKYQRVGTVVPADKNIEDVRFIIRALRVNTPIKKESIWAAVREVPFVWGHNVSTGQESYRKVGEVYIGAMNWTSTSPETRMPGSLTSATHKIFYLDLKKWV